MQLKIKLLIASAATAAIALIAVNLPATQNTDLPVGGGPQPTSDSGIDPRYLEFYEQQVAWKKCGAGEVLCAKVAVPADWNNPTGDRLELAVAYRLASNAQAIGNLIFNPGGPGVSGVNWIKDSYDQLGTKDLRARYNLVGFDPRGVGASQPKIQCLDAKETDQLLYGTSNSSIGSAQDVADTRASLKAFTDSCLENTGPNLAFVDTVSAAKDLDVIRAVFGDTKINYLGFSYGTYLGTMYAQLFPTRVGRMVLDGAIDPTVSEEEQSISQLVGFDRALKNFLTNCLESSDCPFTGNLKSAEAKLSELLLEIESQPLETDSGRELTIWAAITGMLMPLYGQSWWPTLNDGLTEALDGDGTILLSLADTYNDRNEDGSYASNSLEANISISCLDAREPADAKSMAKQNKIALATSPVFGRYWQFGALTCEQWPFPVAERPNTFAAEGSPAILVIGTTGDPATPYEQAVALANRVLKNGQLITFNGEGHTAYGLESSCINNAVDDFFIKNVVPTEDPDCS